jgi:hypothetical protein
MGYSDTLWHPSKDIFGHPYKIFSDIRTGGMSGSAWGLSLLMVVVSLLQTGFLHNYFFRVYRAGMHVSAVHSPYTFFDTYLYKFPVHTSVTRVLDWWDMYADVNATCPGQVGTAVVALVYLKSLALSPASKSQLGTGARARPRSDRPYLV